MRKIAVFTGTRAEYGLLYWLMKEIEQDPDLKLQVVVGGTHLSPEFGLTYKSILDDGFKIDAKIENVLSSDSAVGVAKGMGLAVLALADALDRLSPDAIVILGDRFEALAAAQTALILRIPILHLHGGEITEGAYDDSIRHAITKLACLHFTSTDEYRSRVVQLGESPDRAFNVGAIGLDNIQKSKIMSLEELASSLGFSLKPPYFLITYHPETLSERSAKESFNELLLALDEFPDRQVLFTYPNADDGSRELIELIKMYCNKNIHRAHAVASLGLQRYLSAVKHADAVVGNSSSGIIEVPGFGVPTVNIGNRQKGRLAASSVIHCEHGYRPILEALKVAVSSSFKAQAANTENPYGDGNTSSKIVKILKKTTLEPVKRFYDLPREDVS